VRQRQKKVQAAMAPQMTTEQMLRANALFKGLTEETYADLVRQARPAFYRANEMIFGRGDKGDDVFFVLAGRVRLSVLSLEGRELSFTHAGPGDVFGEIAAFDRGIRTADATAISAVKAITLQHTLIGRLVETQPVFAWNTIALLCQKIRRSDLQLEDVALHAVEVRLARYLLGVIGQQFPGDAAKASCCIRLDMSQAELALLIGASRPKVNAAIGLLEGEGAMTRRGDTIMCEVAKLKEIAAMA
jgi:CRP/FNR family transcriptional regulator, cyclic AMP receptor protein